MIVEIDAEHVRPGSLSAHCATCSRHDLSVPDAGVSPVPGILAVPFVFRLPETRAGAVVGAFSVAVTGVGTGTGRIGHSDGRADVRVKGGWPPLDHRPGRGQLAGTFGGTAAGRGGRATASAAAAVRR